MYKSSKEYDKHHLIGRSNNRWANVEDDRNKIYLLLSRHRGLNSFFLDKQSPKEQIEELRTMCDSVLSEKAKELLDTLLGLKEWEFYADGLVKKGALKSKYKND